ncbi:hypothetical protein [Mycolicibacterium fortuitum]|uniref:hypothetical protein n=1 Tax=Mycolicibacterium fortuitum TaxID=1766 RepID=UPI0007E95C85|nr:hypothetical protein [Mycolicibacterium fortuitum]OBG48904.1 hypothetical protein A5670_28885 [Mycolicibacterium fortuitum]OBJ99287.1 hypothetical protein A5638_08325 [Mycolicibacterium fortuitum]
MSRETADDESDALTVLAALLHGSDLSATQQRVVHDAIADSMIDGATPDREFILRLIELASGRITFDRYKTQTLQAYASGIDQDIALTDTSHTAGQRLRDRHGLT